MKKADKKSKADEKRQTEIEAITEKAIADAVSNNVSDNGTDGSVDHHPVKHQPIRTPLQRPLIRRRGGQPNEVLWPLFFEKKMVSFKPREIRFLWEFAETMDIGKAAKNSDVDVTWAKRFLSRPRAKSFMADRFRLEMTKRGWTVERWMAEGERVWTGEMKPTREQIEVWKEMGARVAPKAPKVGDADGQAQITINIGAGAVDEAYMRQKSIDAQVLDETGT